MQGISIELEVPDSFDPEVTAALLQDFGSFYDTIETRYRKGQLEVDHGKLVVLGTKVLGPETFIQEFKPKPTCPKPD